MLRIGIHDEEESTSFTIEGKLTGRVASELEECWKAAIERQPLKSIVVKLVAVSFVDSEAKELLARMRRQGVKLEPMGCLMRCVVAEIEDEVAK